MMNKFSSARIVKIVISLLVLAVVVYLIKRNWGDISLLLSNASYISLVPLILLQILLVAYLGYPFKLLFNHHGADMPAKEWISLSFASNFANYIAPFRPGLAVRYVYMRQRYQSSLKEMAVITLAYSVYLFLTSTIMLIVLLPFFKSPVINQSILIVFSLLSFAAGWALIYLNAKYASGLQWLPGKLLSFLNHMQNIFDNRKMNIQLMSQFLIINLLATLIYYLAFRAFAVNISFVNILIIAPLTTVSSIVTLTPGNIGVTESIVGVITSYSGSDFATGFLVTSLVRVSNLIVVVVAGAICSMYLMAIVKQAGQRAGSQTK